MGRSQQGTNWERAFDQVLGAVVVCKRRELFVRQMGDLVRLPDDAVEERVDRHRQDRCGLLWIHFLGRFL